MAKGMVCTMGKVGCRVVAILARWWPKGMVVAVAAWWWPRGWWWPWGKLAIGWWP